MGSTSSARSRVQVGELFDRLVQYRNRELGHGAAGRRPEDFYARMGRTMLAGVSELLQQLDVLAGRRLVYIEEVRLQKSGDYRIEGYDLLGESPRRITSMEWSGHQALSLPRPEQVYIQGIISSRVNETAPAVTDFATPTDPPPLSCSSPLLVYDPRLEEILFLNSRRNRGRCEYLCYTTGEHEERDVLEGEPSNPLAAFFGANDAGMRPEQGGPESLENEQAAGCQIGADRSDPRPLVSEGRPLLPGSNTSTIAVSRVDEIQEGSFASRKTSQRRGLGGLLRDAALGAVRLALGPSTRGAVIGALCGLICWSVSLHPVLQSLEEWFHDSSFTYRGRRTTSAKVVLVGIDDASLDRLPKPLVFLSPELAEVVAYLQGRGAKVIGLELMIRETLNTYPGLQGERLGRAAAHAGNVVMPAVLKDDGGLLRPIQTWQTGARLGLVNLDEDNDYFLRRQSPSRVVMGHRYNHFSLAMLNVAGRAQADTDGRLRVDGRVVPLDDQGRLRINFVGPPGTFPYVPFQAVLGAARGDSPPTIDFRDALVIIGLTARSLGDYHATPYANGNWPTLWAPRPKLMAGPEIYANLVATMVDGAYIQTPGWLEPLPLLLVIGALLGATFSRISLVGGLGVAVAHHLGWRVVSFAAFWAASWRVEIVAMLLTGGVCYAATFAFRWLWLRRLFGVVKSDAIARALENSPRRQWRTGEERTLTVLFADIRGFTAFSDEHSAREVLALLNTYFDLVVPIVEKHGGTIDKYIGDQLMALFGAPGNDPDHAAHAVSAAVAMIERIHEQEPRWAGLDFPQLSIGVGIHTGTAALGMVGSRNRLDYTAVGDAVNVAASIEAATRELDAEILISARTFRGLSAAERVRLGCVERPERAKVKGRREMISLHRVVAADRAAPRPVGRGAGPKLVESPV